MKTPMKKPTKKQVQKTKARQVSALTERPKANQRQIIHVTAGIDGVWEPTEDELADIAKMFADAYALAESQQPIVATRTGIHVVVVDIP